LSDERWNVWFEESFRHHILQYPEIENVDEFREELRAEMRAFITEKDIEFRKKIKNLEQRMMADLNVMFRDVKKLLVGDIKRELAKRRKGLFEDE
jgi:hypothetical protein